MSSSGSMEFKRIGKLLTAAAAVVGGVLGLFSSVLDKLAPPAAGLSPTYYAGIASIASLLVLLLVVLSMPARPSARQRHVIAACGIAIGVAAFVCLFAYLDLLNTHVFEYAEPGTPPARHVRGEFTAMGERMSQDLSVAGAVHRVGGLHLAEQNQLLWTERSRAQIELRLLKLYVASVALLCMALFGVAVALLAARRAG